MPFQFIAGSDDFLVQRAASTEWDRLCSVIGDSNSCEVIDGHAGNVDEVQKSIHQAISAIRTISLFGDRKAVWLKHVSFFADSVTGRAECTSKAVEHLIEVLQEVDDSMVAVLISGAPVDRRRKAFKWLEKNGNSQIIEAGKDDSVLVHMAQQEAARDGVTFETGSAETLVEKLNRNTRVILQETQKLVTYLHGHEKKITMELIHSMVPAFGEGDFFETVEAFYSWNLEHTLEALHRHFFAGHDARPVLAALQNRNRLLIQLKSLQVVGIIRDSVSKRSLESAAAQLQSVVAQLPDPSDKSTFNLFSQNPWYLGRLSRSLQNCSLARLILFQKAFTQTFREIVDRPRDQESVLRKLVMDCLTA